MPLIDKDQTKANPIRLDPVAPIPKYIERIPKYPAEEIVTTENRSVIKPIHLEAIFWFTIVTIECFCLRLYFSIKFCSFSKALTTYAPVIVS